MFRLYEELPSQMVLDDRKYELNLAFDNVLYAMHALQDKEMIPDDRLEVYLSLIVEDDIPDDVDRLEMFYQIQEILSTEAVSSVKYDLNGDPIPAARGSDKPDFDFDFDAKYIYAAFKQVYNIDLIEEQGELNWIKFVALLNALPEDTVFRQIRQIRSTKLSDIKDKEYRKQIKQQQKALALPDSDEDDSKSEEVKDYGSDGNVKILIEADGKEAISSVEGVKEAIGGLGGKAQKTGGLFKSIFSANLVSGAVAKVLGLIGDSLGGLNDDLSESSSTWKTFQGNMSNLKMPQGEINKTKKSLQDFATQTIYSASDMASTYSQLAAVGTKNTTQLVKGFGGLAAASAEPQQAMKTLSQQATQMAAKPKVAWEDFKLILEQTPAGVASVAKTMGMSTTQMIKNVQDGKIATQDFFNAIAKTGTNANFSKMATQYKTVGQAMDGLRETMVTKLQPAYDKVSSVGINAISGIADAISSVNLDAIVNGFMGLLNVLQTIGSGAMTVFKKMIADLTPVFLNLKGMITRSFSGFSVDKLKSILDPVSKVFNAIFDGITSALNVFVAVTAGIMNTVGKAFSKVFNGKELSDMGSKVSDLGQVFTDIFGDISSVIGQVGGVIEGLPWESIFNGVKVALSGLLDVIKNVGKFVSAAFKNDIVKSFAVAIASAIVALKGFNKAKSAIDSFKSVMDVGKVIKATAKDADLLKFALGNMAKESKIAAAAQKALNTVTSMNPWVALAVGIAAVVAGLVWFFTQTETGRKAWSSFVNWLKSAWNSLTTVASNVWKSITSFFSGAVDKVRGAWSGITGFFSDMWSGIKKGASNAAKGTQSAWNGTKSFFSNLWSGVQSGASTAWSSISSSLSTTWNAIVAVATAIWNTFGSSLMQIWNGIVQMASGVWNLLKTIIMAPILLVIDLITGNFTQLKADLSLIWTSITQAASQIWNGLVSYFSGILSFISTYFSTVWNGIKTVATVVWNAIVSAIKGAWNGAVSFGKSVWNGFKAFMSGLWSGIKAAALSAWNAIKAGINNFIAGTVSGAKSIWSGFKSFMSGLWNGIKSGAVSAWNGLKNSVINIARSVVSGVKGAWSGFKKIVSSVVSGIKSGFNALSHFSLAKAGRAIIDGFVGGLKGAWEAGKKFVGGIAKWITDHKGPISYDAKLLIPAGKAIMSGLNGGLQKSFSDVQDTVSGMAGKLSLAMTPQVSFPRAETLIGGTLNVPASSSNAVYNTYNTTNNSTASANSETLELLRAIANKQTVVDGSSFASAYEQFGSTETARRNQLKGRGLAIGNKF